ncbi:purine and uridine phosphorylase [Byssothecium circinans]|uniref:Purine and uridine phosphorylase n=1 Tax=Byssothecium circinans TaxID=147558 RepID=A0A6A5UC31_9PLEO|nr:purine and uridine phosphorylase [Byssothecium circinans]
MTATPKLRLLRNRPLCIICGRPGEAEEIARTLGIEKNRITGDEVMKVNNAYTFYTGSFTLDSGEKLEYYVTSSLRQGIQSFTVCASVLFSILRPRFAIHAGVCAGYDDPSGKLEMKLTDVVFGEAATNYQEGKMDYVDGEFLMRPDYNRVLYDAGDMQAFAEAASRPTYHYGEYLSGSSVRTDASIIFEKIRRNVNRNAIALDMEASAFLELCRHFDGDQVISLGVVKGISDYGDPGKGSVPNAKEKALENTANALKDWVIHRIPGITWTVDESEEPGAKIVPGYYDNFIRRVLDNYLQGWPVKDKSDRSIEIPRREIKGFKTVLPRGNDPSFAQEIGHVEKLSERYNVSQVDIGGSTAGRYLHYKGGYLIDWARCVNSLKICDDGEYQVGVFSRLLSSESYYKGSSDSPALASVVSWEDTVEWLKGLELEGSKEKPDETRTLKEGTEEEKQSAGDASGKNQAQDQSAREGRPPQRVDPQAQTVLGEGRHASPATTDGAAASDEPRPTKGAARRLASAPVRTGSNKVKEKQQSKTRSPKRARSKEVHEKKKTFSLSPKRSMSRLLKRWRSTPPDQHPLPQTTAPS